MIAALPPAQAAPLTGADTDEAALAENYVSVVPCLFDLTNQAALTALAGAWQILPPAAEAVLLAPPQAVAGQDYGVAAKE